MNDMTITTGSGPLTMSSREIAELCEKQHKHVTRDIKVMLDQLGMGEEGYAQNWTNPQNGQSYPEYTLPKDLTLTLVAGYNVVLRKRIIDRWMELESGAVPKALDYSDPRVVLGVIGYLQDEVTKKDELIAEQGGRLKKLDRLEGAKGSMCISDAAKTLGVKRDEFFDFMSARRWIFKRPGNKNWLAYDDKRKALLLDHEDHLYMDYEGRERVSTRVLVTAKGLVKLADLLEQSLH